MTIDTEDFSRGGFFYRIHGFLVLLQLEISCGGTAVSAKSCAWSTFPVLTVFGSLHGYSFFLGRSSVSITYREPFQIPFPTSPLFGRSFLLLSERKELDVLKWWYPAPETLSRVLNGAGFPSHDAHGI